MFSKNHKYVCVVLNKYKYVHLFKTMDKTRKIIVNILTIIITIYVLLVAFVKLKMPFWSRQPVFHFYNIYNWIKPNQIIERENIKQEKFFDEDIEFSEFKILSAEKKEEFTEFIKNNYMPKKNEKYTPTHESIIVLFEGHNNKSFISLKIYNGKILSSMISLPVEFYENQKKKIIYLADYLCIDKEHRHKQYASNQIHTHIYHARNRVPTKIAFFKRENRSNFIVPYTVYNNYIFKIDNWELCYTFDQPNISVVFVNKSNLNKFNKIYQESKKNFPIFLSHSLGHIFNLVEKNQMIIMCLMVNEEFVCYYIFKNPHTTYNGVNSLEVCSSYKGETINNDLFTLGFMISMSLVSKDLESKIILVENLANNDIIINLLLQKYAYFAKTINSLYLYNYASYPKYSNNIMCIL